jgi:hypothetical protein
MQLMSAMQQNETPRLAVAATAAAAAVATLLVAGCGSPEADLRAQWSLLDR